MGAKADWIAVDWGTSNVRVWGMDSAGKTVFAEVSDKGMGRIGPADYPGILEGLIGDAVPADGQVRDVVICGMAGARQGWREAPYLDVPADLGELGRRAVAPEMPGGRWRVRILSGVCQRRAGAEDVMRGEETQILGLLAQKPGFSGTAIMPGTHSKWVDLDNGRITGFSTAMTGELFDVLKTHSVLRHSMPEDLVGQDTEEGVAAGLDAGIAAPERLTTSLFRSRAASLLSGKSPHWCAGYLSGLLVGAEVAGHKDRIGEATLPLIGSARLCRLYASALSRMGVATETVDATAATLAGLAAAREHLQ